MSQDLVSIPSIRTVKEGLCAVEYNLLACMANLLTLKVASCRVAAAGRFPKPYALHMFYPPRGSEAPALTADAVGWDLDNRGPKLAPDVMLVVGVVNAQYRGVPIVVGDLGARLVHAFTHAAESVYAVDDSWPLARLSDSLLHVRGVKFDDKKMAVTGTGEPPGFKQTNIEDGDPLFSVVYDTTPATGRGTPRFECEVTPTNRWDALFYSPEIYTISASEGTRYTRIAYWIAQIAWILSEEFINQSLSPAVPTNIGSRNTKDGYLGQYEKHEQQVQAIEALACAFASQWPIMWATRYDPRPLIESRLPFLDPVVKENYEKYWLPAYKAMRDQPLHKLLLAAATIGTNITSETYFGSQPTFVTPVEMPLDADLDEAIINAIMGVKRPDTLIKVKDKNGGTTSTTVPSTIPPGFRSYIDTVAEHNLPAVIQSKQVVQKLGFAMGSVLPSLTLDQDSARAAITDGHRATEPFSAIAGGWIPTLHKGCVGTFTQDKRYRNDLYAGSESKPDGVQGARRGGQPAISVVTLAHPAGRPQLISDAALIKELALGGSGSGKDGRSFDRALDSKGVKGKGIARGYDPPSYGLTTDTDFLLADYILPGMWMGEQFTMTKFGFDDEQDQIALMIKNLFVDTQPDGTANPFGERRIPQYWASIQAEPTEPGVISPSGGEPSSTAETPPLSVARLHSDMKTAGNSLVPAEMALFLRGEFRQRVTVKQIFTGRYVFIQKAHSRPTMVLKQDGHAQYGRASLVDSADTLDRVNDSYGRFVLVRKAM